MQEDRTIFIAVVIMVAALVGALFGGVGALVVTDRLDFVSQVADQFGLPLPPETAQEELAQTIVELVDQEEATISMVEAVMPSVASVVVRKPLSEIEDYFYTPFIFEDETESVESGDELIEIGGGTAFFVTGDGLLLTNGHVVSDSEAVYSIVTNEGDEYPVEVVASDVFFDLAVLQVIGEFIAEDQFAVAEFGDSDLISIGQTVIAIGNTLSEYRNTVTKGVVSGIGRRVVASDYFVTEVIEEAIQTDAAINPGNSGGPLVNLFGQVIGINTAVSSSGEGIGFAIPINSAKKIVEDVIEFGRIVRPWLGVRYVMIDEDYATENELELTEGARVISGSGAFDFAVIPESPADLAGLQEDDIIVSINSELITEDNDLAKVINKYSPGDAVSLEVWRQGEYTFLTTILTELDPNIFE